MRVLLTEPAERNLGTRRAILVTVLADDMRSSARAREFSDSEEGRGMRMAPDLKVWTVDDLASLPDDGQRYEVIDGALLVTPSPSLRHQHALLRLAVRLESYLAREAIGMLVIGPAEIRFSRHRGVQPDLFVAPLTQGRRPRDLSDISELLLAVEVLSPSSARADRVAKRAMYREEGVADYWVVDLDARAIECSTPADSRVDVAATSLKWHPAGATAPLVVDLERYFSEVLDS